MNRRLFTSCLVLLLVASSTSWLHGIEIGSVKDFPVGTIRFSMQTKEGRHFVSVSWGGQTVDTGSEGPVLKVTSKALDDGKKTIKLDERTLDQLFESARKLRKGYYLPRASTGDRSNRDHFQLYIGHLSDPLRLSFPADEPHLWNRAASCWKIHVETLKKAASIELPLAAHVAIIGKKAPMPGVSSIRDFTSMDVNVSRVHRSKIDYGTISAKWDRAKDGKISFSLSYINRAADSVHASPPVSEIRPLFEQVQKLAKGYRHPSFARNKAAARSRNYDSIDIYLEPGGHTGEYLLPYFSTDASQWGGADKLWSFLVNLFAEEDREKIIQ